MEYDPKHLIHELKDGHGYDYIAAHYWEMDKEELKDVALELIYALSSQLPSVENDVLDSASVELKERWEVE